MTVQFSSQAIAALSVSLPTEVSDLIPRPDPGKEHVRKWLLEIDNAQPQ